MKENAAEDTTNTDLELLEAVFTALHGPNWQSYAARGLGVNIRTVQRWVAGSSKVPDKIWPDVFALAVDQERAARDVADKVRERMSKG